MRAGGLTAARATLLAGATVLAFFSGGYFDQPRAWAGLAAWGLVAVAVLCAGRDALPDRHDHRAWLAVGGLMLWGGWTLASIAWAPLAGSAYHSGQLVVLYAGALLAAMLLLSGRSVRAAVEPALAAGILIVVGYGLSERLLPGLLHFSRSVSAQGRLEQPLTYWNAMGELAGLGFVLAARLAGDERRMPWLRAAAAAAAAPLGLGVYLSYSRGALFACAAGLLALVVVAPRRAQLRAVLAALLAGVLASVAGAALGSVHSLRGGLSTRELQGAVMLAVLVVLAAGAAAFQVAAGRVGIGDARGALALPRRAPWLALGLVCAGLAVAIVVGAKEGTSRPLGPGATRYATLESNRYDYWDVALKAFAAQPVRGVGAGGWAVWWLRDRTIHDFAQDAHSLPLQTLAELGLVGFALLIAVVAGLALACRDAHRLAPAAAAGPIAGLVVYAAHAPLDWDWQMPAVTLVAIVLGGMALVQARDPTGDPGPRARGDAGPRMNAATHARGRA